MSDITVYGKPGCRACKNTTRILTQNGVEHTYVDFTQDEDALAFITAQGVKSAPYVTSPVGNWAGQDEAKLNELIASVK